MYIAGKTIIQLNNCVETATTGERERERPKFVEVGRCKELKSNIIKIKRSIIAKCKRTKS